MSLAIKITFVNTYFQSVKKKISKYASKFRKPNSSMLQKNESSSEIELISSNKAKANVMS